MGSEGTFEDLRAEFNGELQNQNDLTAKINQAITLFTEAERDLETMTLERFNSLLAAFIRQIERGA